MVEFEIQKEQGQSGMYGRRIDKNRGGWEKQFVQKEELDEKKANPPPAA